MVMLLTGAVDLAVFDTFRPCHRKQWVNTSQVLYFTSSDFFLAAFSLALR